jgi:FKBP-type peptidyl-prolyl cis-trans isomerase FkpA
MPASQNEPGDASMTSRLNSVRLAAALALAAGLATTARADDSAALAAAAKEPAAVVSASGVVFKSIKEGSGESPKATDTVKVYYRGTFPDGKEFDASKPGNPISFPLNRVIPCWTEGVQKLKVGGKGKLTCPSATAYGPRGAGGVIPPNATLVFEVELLAIN